MSAQDNLKRRYRLYDAPKPLLPVELFKEAHKARGLALLRGQAATEHRHRDDADLRSTGDSQDQATKPQPQRSAEQILDVARPGSLQRVISLDQAMQQTHSPRQRLKLEERARRQAETRQVTVSGARMTAELQKVLQQQVQLQVTLEEQGQQHELEVRQLEDRIADVQKLKHELVLKLRQVLRQEELDRAQAAAAPEEGELLH